MDLAIERRLPVGNGILTVEDEAQAMVAGRPPLEGDKGGEAAKAMLALWQIKRGAEPSRSEPWR